MPSRVPASGGLDEAYDLPAGEPGDPYGTPTAFDPFRPPQDRYGPADEPPVMPFGQVVGPPQIAEPHLRPPAPQTPPPAPSAAPRGKQRTGRRPRSRAWPGVVVSAVLALLCAIVAGVAATSAGAELTRGPDAAEIQRATADEIARRWQMWPADRIFPLRLSYVTEQGGSEWARRVGVSSRTDCAAAVDARLRAPLRAAKCRAVLRATYLDALQGVVVTIGVAAFPDQASAAAAHNAFPRGGRPSPGLRALAFPGTVTDRFTAAGRQHGYARQAGPYVVAVTAGQVDGRPARAVGRQRETLFAFTADLADGVLRALTTPLQLDCAAKEWRC